MLDLFQRKLMSIFSIFDSSRLPPYRPTIYPIDYEAKLKSPWVSPLWLKYQKLACSQGISSESIHLRVLDTALRISEHALVSRNIHEPIYFVDYGGGVGSLYRYIRDFLKPFPLKYLVVDDFALSEQFIGNWSADCYFSSFTSKILPGWERSQILCLCASLQYSPDFFRTMQECIKSFSPDILVILLLPTATDARQPAKVIQNVFTPDRKFCGSALLTLFSPAALEGTMAKLSYRLLIDIPQSYRPKKYFIQGCSNKSYENVILMNYVFMRT